jgi:hypothetical protein
MTTGTRTSGIAAHALSGHTYRNRKPSSRALVSVVIASFIALGVSLIVDQWWLFWLGAGVVLVAMPAGKLTGITDDAEPRD